MKRIVRWLLVSFGILLVVGFTAFLYLIPPFTLMSPDSFVTPEANATPKTDGIADDTERVIAERGRHLVLTAGCTGCHTPPSPDGSPNWERFLAGGQKLSGRYGGTVYTRNLTPDEETGTGRYTKEEIVYRLRTGQFHDGRMLASRAMPWPVFSNWTDEDRYAVATYLKHLKPIRSVIPEPSSVFDVPDSAASEAFFGRDYSGQ